MTGSAPPADDPGRAADPSGRLRVLVCPDSFKGTIDATEAAAALAAGWAQARPADEVRCLPLADGGEGTLDAIAACTPSARRHDLTVTGPDDRPVRAAWLELPGGEAVVELAACSGLGLLERPLPLDAHTLGLGEAIAVALAAGSTRLLVAIGGSSSTDGGAGLLTALGARLRDGSGEPARRGARGLLDLARADLSQVAPPPIGGVRVLSDVTSPLVGPDGAAAVFGPQKGLEPAAIPEVDAALARWAELLGVDPMTPGAGAAGGTGAALLAWGGRIVPGSAAVAEAVGLDAAVAASDVVVTGEGRYDAQTASGKVVAHVASLAARHGTRLAVVAGAFLAEPPPGSSWASLTEIAGAAERAMAEPAPFLREAGRRLARAGVA